MSEPMNISTAIGPPVDGSRSACLELVVWQLQDSAFPAGAFAHSCGLEAARKWNFVTGPDDLREFLRHNLVQTGRSLIPFVSECHLNFERLYSLDIELDAFLSNHVTNRASRAQGRAFLAAAEIAFQSRNGRVSDKDIDRQTESRRGWWLSELRDQMSNRQLKAHLPVVFGAITRLLEIPLQTAIRIFLYASVRDLISAAVRLNIVGSLEGQSIQFEIAELIERTAIHGESLSLRDAAQTASMIDLVQGTHDRLYTKLFQS
jgi:urease accessory protein